MYHCHGTTYEIPCRAAGAFVSLTENYCHVFDISLITGKEHDNHSLCYCTKSSKLTGPRPERKGPLTWKSYIYFYSIWKIQSLPQESSTIQKCLPSLKSTPINYFQSSTVTCHSCFLSFVRLKPKLSVFVLKILQVGRNNHSIVKIKTMAPIDKDVRISSPDRTTDHDIYFKLKNMSSYSFQQFLKLSEMLLLLLKTFCDQYKTI